MKKLLAPVLVLASAVGLAAFSPVAANGPPMATYRVTIENLTSGQPLSPGLAVTHRPNSHVFQVGSLASESIEAIAEDGNEGPAVAALIGAPLVTDGFDLDHPLTPAGTTVGGFSDTVTFEIEARPGDRLSVVTMLICTNDGFAGLDGGHLPMRGTRVFHLNGYDAGTEDNTEASEDIVDPCSGLGPVPLSGDPDGNDDPSVDTSPHGPIHHHSNIQGGSDLSPDAHRWTDPVAEVTVERIN